ncbi:MAG: flagellar type III secretion system protein FlhB [Gemmobacter sp.]|nr:flagellar type III secretion system protein FlhB [Gemmobacter sp.]
MEQSDEDKEFAPTERRLADARLKGEVPMGRDLLAAAGVGGLVLALLSSPGSLISVADALMVVLDQAESLAPLLGSGHPTPLGAFALRLGGGLLPLFALPLLAVAVMLVSQRALVFAPTRLEPKLSRISPLKGAVNKFGRNGLFEFAKSVVKLVTFSAVLGTYAMARMDGLIAGMALGPAQITGMLGQLVIEFLLLVLVILSIIGGLDLAWQRFEHTRQHRMTRKELTDEMKQSDGDPQMKAQRRQKAVDIASNRMLADVPKADVVIVNPTHYAVALKWNRMARGAPVCIAKGVDEVAARIREAAAEAGVPLHRDPATARALHASVDIGQEIQPDLYRPVAAAIRFAESMRRRAKARGAQRRLM